MVICWWGAMISRWSYQARWGSKPSWTWNFILKQNKFFFVTLWHSDPYRDQNGKMRWIKGNEHVEGLIPIIKYWSFSHCLMIPNQMYTLMIIDFGIESGYWWCPLIVYRTFYQIKRRKGKKEMRKMETMLRSWWASLLGTKRCEIAVCSPSINHGRWILTCSHRSLWILKCNLRNQKNKQKDPVFKIRQTNERSIDKCYLLEN